MLLVWGIVSCIPDGKKCISSVLKEQTEGFGKCREENIFPVQYIYLQAQHINSKTNKQKNQQVY